MPNDPTEYRMLYLKPSPDRQTDVLYPLLLPISPVRKKGVLTISVGKLWTPLQVSLGQASRMGMDDSKA